MSQGDMLPTGDAVVDRMLGGGIPENRPVLVQNPSVTSDEMHGFYTNAAEQILRM